MNDDKLPKAKDKRTAVLLSLIPWGVFCRLYTYQKDKRRLRKSLVSIAIWLGLTLSVWLLPEIESVKSWRADLNEQGTDTELAHLVLLLCVGGIFILVILEAWLQTIFDSVKRSAGWYERYPGRSRVKTKSDETAKKDSGHK